MRGARLLTLCCLVASCATTSESPSTQSARVKVLDGMELQGTTDLEPFLLAVSSAWHSGGRGALQRLVERWPDLSLRVLRDRPEHPVRGRLLSALCAAFGGDESAHLEYENLRSALLDAEQSDCVHEREVLSQWLDRAGRSRVLASEGRVLLIETNRGEHSLALWRDALSLAGEIGDPSQMESLLSRLPVDLGRLKERESASWSRAAELRLLREEPQLALVDACRAVAVARDGSDLANAELNKARAQHQLGHRGEALITVGRAKAAKTPVTPAVLALEGLLAAEGKDLQRARELFRRALATSGWSGEAQAASDLALVLAVLGEEELAEEEFDRAAQLGTRNEDWNCLAQTWSNRATWLSSRGQIEEASSWQSRAEGLVREHGLLLR